MKPPDTAYRRHWLYNLGLKIVVLACVVYFALRIFGVIG
jgi:hypothetical protein